MSGRTLWLAGLLTALLVAGVGSFYASSHPDGLEHVAETTGFLDSATESAAGASPTADYQTRGIEDQRVSGGVAGILGALVVLGLGYGLFWGIRRRGRGDRADAGDEADSPSRV